MEWKGDILAVGVTEKDMGKDENLKFQNPILKKLDSHLGGLLAEASLEEDFTGKAGRSTVLRLPGLGSKRIGLIGLGQCTSATTAYRSLGEAVAGIAKSSQASSVAIALASPGGLSGDSKLSTASAIASGIYLCFFSQVWVLLLCCFCGFIIGESWWNDLTRQEPCWGFMKIVGLSLSQRSQLLNLWIFLVLELELS